MLATIMQWRVMWIKINILCLSLVKGENIDKYVKFFSLFLSAFRKKMHTPTPHTEKATGTAV